MGEVEVREAMLRWPLRPVSIFFSFISLLWASSTISSALGRKARPLSVRETERLSRTKSLVPRCFSSSLMWWLIEGWVRPLRRAASEKFSVCATEMK